MTDRQPGDHLQWLAETKFYPPLVRDDVIPRWHLIHKLRKELASHPLTLLSAPAGYGKTTLLAALPRTYPDLSLAWLSLDEEDNDPVRFLTALIVALQHLDPGCGTTAQSLLTGNTPGGLEVRRVISVLINDVLETLAPPFALLLDDLHRITEPSIFVALDYLLAHRPPQLHLVVATRVDPPLGLARLRARGEVAELRLAELRFSDEEAAAFLNERLDLGLTKADLDLLQARAEGWAVGLRLLATSLVQASSEEDRSLFLRHLAENDRNIFEFLAEEVFNLLEPEVRTFLLETAILPELAPTLCRAVTGRRDAGRMLEELYRRNLFLLQVPLSEIQANSEFRGSLLDLRQIAASNLKAEAHYRYHDFFAEFLRHRLGREMPERIPELHLHAAQAESNPVRAVSHYLAAGSWSKAADIIEQIGTEMFTHGYLDTLSRWINALPASVRDTRPRLLHYLSNCAFSRGAWQEVQPLLERALQGFEAAGDEAGQGEVLADLATCAAAVGDLERSAVLYDRALSYPIPPYIRVQSLLGRALSKGAWGEWVESERDFNTAIALIEQSSGLDPLYLLVFPFFHPEFAVLPGALERLERICRQARAQVGDELSLSRLMVEEMRTILYLFRGQLPEAIRVGESALELRQRLDGHPYLSLDAALFLMIAHAARGDYAAVEPLFDLLFLGIDQTGEPPPDLPLYLFYAGRVRWLQGRFTEAREIYAQICSLLEDSPLRDAPEAHICRTWMWSLLQITEGHSAKAERALRRPEVLEQRDRASTIHGCTRLMLARLYLQQGRQQEALTELDWVLTYHQQLGIPFAILVEGQSIVPLLRLSAEEGVQERYAAYLLDVLGADDQPRPVDVPETGSTLTPREVEVLGLVAAGYSNRAIAEELVISEWTVKSHLTKVYRKLDASSRTQAIAQARELGLS
ncbi:MAG TPA: LuxR C-terminal-related transcriptional regulator [Candidatus Binatia bacterium]|nr:LuxR C-terminal-related transcriptional regulator [Candidatus Binatia bacterium]